jgi:hypothetical protein
VATQADQVQLLDFLLGSLSKQFERGHSDIPDEDAVIRKVVAILADPTSKHGFYVVARSPITA